MRILYCGNNRLGLEVLVWLRARGEDVVGLVVHPPERRTCGAEILAAAGLPPGRVFDGSRLGEPGTREAIRDLGADLALSVLFSHIFDPPFIALFRHGILNLHPALLPYNRGAFPNVWSIVDRTPAGVTLHYVDAGLDTGDVVARREVPVEPVDTGESLYRKLERASLALFAEAWPLIRAGGAPRLPQPPGGTFHRRDDVARIDRIDLDASCRAGDLIDILRARTFLSHDGAYFIVGGRKVHLRLHLEYDEAGSRGSGED
jgi:methionyl-tRNA formyltransferase